MSWRCGGLCFEISKFRGFKVLGVVGFLFLRSRFSDFDVSRFLVYSFWASRV